MTIDQEQMRRDFEGFILNNRIDGPQYSTRRDAITGAYEDPRLEVGFVSWKAALSARPDATLTHEGTMGQAVDSPATTNPLKISSEPAAYMLKLARPSMIPAEWLQPMVDQGRTKADKWAPLYTAEAVQAAKVDVLEQVQQALKNATGEYIISYDELTHSFWSQAMEDLADKIRGSAPD